MPDDRQTPRRRALFALGAAALLVTAAAGCGSSDSSGSVSPGTTASKGAATTTAAKAGGAGAGLADPCGRMAAPPKTYDHVVILMEENRTWTGGRSPAVGLGFSNGLMPFLSGLAKKCTYYASWHETNETQNSLNQYVGLTSGIANDSTVNDCNPSDTCKSTDDNLFRQIREAGGTPRTFVDGASEPCSVGTNAAKHIPALYFQGGDDASHCKDEVLPFKELDPDKLPTLAFIVPDQCNDGHNCADSIADSWAKQALTPILDGKSYAEGKTLVVVIYDEDAEVPNLLIAPTAKAGVNRTLTGSHADLLKTIELALDLPILQQGQLPEAVSLRPSAHI
jgi:phospholipase C